jgi:hypothetical protein
MVRLRDRRDSLCHPPVRLVRGTSRLFPPTFPSLPRFDGQLFADDDFNACCEDGIGFEAVSATVRFVGATPLSFKCEWWAGEDSNLQPVDFHTSHTVMHRLAVTCVICPFSIVFEGFCSQPVLSWKGSSDGPIVIRPHNGITGFA